jgi:hypothetical protein
VMVGVSEMLDAQGRVGNSIKHLSRFGYASRESNPLDGQREATRTN